jgi:hypothetical protein
MYYIILKLCYKFSRIGASFSGACMLIILFPSTSKHPINVKQQQQQLLCM